MLKEGSNISGYGGEDNAEDGTLCLLKQIFVSGEAERLRGVLKAKAVYITDNSDIEYEGAEEIISRFTYVHGNHIGKYFAHIATLISEKDGHCKGERCIVLSVDEENNYHSIVFVKLDKTGKIRKIEVTNDLSYLFEI